MLEELKTFNLYGKQCRLSFNDMPAFQTKTIRLGYWQGDEWIYIHGENINTNAAEVDANAELKRIMEVLNKKANEMWAEDTPEPQQGVARIIWLVENEVYVENNELRLK